METSQERKNRIVAKVLKDMGAQPGQNRIYRIGNRHFRCYHIFAMKDQPIQYAYSFYYGISQKILQNIKQFKDPHILIICDHKSKDLNGEDAFDILFIPASVLWDNLQDAPFKPSSLRKNDPAWNMDIRVTRDRKYHLDIPGRDKIPLGNYLNKVSGLGASREFRPNSFPAEVKTLQTDNTNNLPNKADCEMALAALRKGAKGSLISKEEVFHWLELEFERRGISLKSNWKVITERNLNIWFG